MFQLDDKFLQDLGLDQLPEDQKQAFKEHIYNELELRVGVRLSEGLSEERLSEFESFVDRNEEKVKGWLAANVPSFASDPAYVQLRDENQNNPQPLSEIGLMSEYASLKWLAMNRPNYREVVAQVLDELKQEIKNNRDAILGSDQSAA